MEHELILCVVCLEAAAHCGCSQEARGAMMISIGVRILREQEAAAQQQQEQQHQQHQPLQSQQSPQTQPSWSSERARGPEP